MRSLSQNFSLVIKFEIENRVAFPGVCACVQTNPHCKSKKEIKKYGGMKTKWYKCFVINKHCESNAHGPN